MLGTLLNALAVIIGSIIGILIHTKLPKKLTTTAFQAIGLFTIFLGISMALKTQNFLIMIFSIVLGSLLGEILDIDSWVNRFGEYLKKKLNSKESNFSEGFVTAFLLFCMGSMTILGAIEEGLGNPPNLLLSKSVLDGFSSIALASSLGIGVLFSALPLLIFQGGITLFAASLQDILTLSLINEITAVGGLLLIGLGITILEIKEIKVLNMIPSLVLAALLAYFLL